MSSSIALPLQKSDPLVFTEGKVFIPVERFREHPDGFADINSAFIRFTSGTTGDAKGVVLSHETIYERIHAANKALQIGPDDRIVWMLSMAYHFAVSIVAYLSFGATIILCKNYFGSTVIKAASDHKATILYAAPTHYELMTHARGTESLPDLRFAIATTTTLRSEVADTFYNCFGKPLNETYGIIEIGLPFINVGNPLEKKGSVGRLLPDYEMRTKKFAGANDLQEIFIRGVGLLDAYYEPWTVREQILEKNGGWFSSGDLGYVDDEGYLYIRGRSKEMISVGGMKFFPQEAEAVLELHPAVREACVFGCGDTRRGEVPHAHLVIKENASRPSQEELNVFCSRHLAVYKIPEQYIFVDTLARTASGKLIRNPLKLS